MRRSPLVLLGPQRHAPTVRATLDSLGIDGPCAVITAGWEEREEEDGELREHLGVTTVNPGLFRRAAEVFEADPALLAATRDRLDVIRAQQELYRLRLRHALAATRELFQRTGPAELLAAERASAIAALRELDAHHLEAARRQLETFEGGTRYRDHALIARHRAEVAEELAPCAALLVAGGHVGVLRNRLRMFGVLDAWGDRPLVAWSAGAMALGRRVVLFHDRPPQGPGDAEVARPGLDAYDGLLPLPPATARLDLADPARVQVFARRFGPDRCVALDPGARVDQVGGEWVLHPGARALTVEGTLAEAAKA